MNGKCVFSQFCVSHFTINSKASQVSAIACVTSTLCEANNLSAFQFSRWIIPGCQGSIDGHHKAENWGCPDTLNTNWFTPKVLMFSGIRNFLWKLLHYATLCQFNLLHFLLRQLQSITTASEFTTRSRNGLLWTAAGMSVQIIYCQSWPICKLLLRNSRKSFVVDASLAVILCAAPAGRLLKFESRVSSITTPVSSIKNGCIRCFLLIRLKLETRV